MLINFVLMRNRMDMFLSLINLFFWEGGFVYWRNVLWTHHLAVINKILYHTFECDFIIFICVRRAKVLTDHGFNNAFITGIHQRRYFFQSHESAKLHILSK